MKNAPEHDEDISKDYGFLEVLRHLERNAGDAPRIGQNIRLRDEIASMGQDPFLGFATSELSVVDLKAKPAKVRPNFLGFYGPFGPLPLAMTREVEHWVRNGDPAFVHFTDMFTTRFLQLFYRTWSDSRAITQFDHPSGGGFAEMLRAFTGDAGASFLSKSPVDDTVRLRYTSLQTGRIRTPSRLRKLLEAHFEVKVRVEEFASSWLHFPDDELSKVGVSGMGLGQDVKLGNKTLTTNEKLIIHLDCSSNEEYQDFLPGRSKHFELVDLVLGYLGQFFLVDVQLWLPRSCLAPAKLGSSLELGWSGKLNVDKGTEEIERVLRNYLEQPAFIERVPKTQTVGKTRIPGGAQKSDEWLLWGVLKFNSNATLYDQKMVIHIALNEEEADNFKPTSWMYDKFLHDILKKVGRFEQLEIVVLVPHEIEDEDGSKMKPRETTSLTHEPKITMKGDLSVQVCRYQIN